MVDYEKVITDYEQFVDKCCCTILEILFVSNFEFLIEKLIEGDAGSGYYPDCKIDLSIHVNTVVSRAISDKDAYKLDKFRFSNNPLLIRSCVAKLSKITNLTDRKIYVENNFIKINLEASHMVKIIKKMILEGKVDRDILIELQ